MHKHLSLINEVKYQLHVSNLKSFKVLPYTPSECNCELQFINAVKKEKVQKNFCPNSQPAISSAWKKQDGEDLAAKEERELMKIWLKGL